MMKNKNKHLKPTEIDGHFRYICPNCGLNHWASFKEVSTKKFIIVCDCEAILSPTRIVDINVVFAKKKKKERPQQIEQQDKTVKVKTETKSNIIPEATLEKAIKMIVAFGFSKGEAEAMLKQTYSNNPTENIALLVKNSIASIGEING